MRRKKSRVIKKDYLQIVRIMVKAGMRWVSFCEMQLARELVRINQVLQQVASALQVACHVTTDKLQNRILVVIVVKIFFWSPKMRS